MVKLWFYSNPFLILFIQEFNKTLNPENLLAQNIIKTSHDRKITFQIDQFDQTDQSNLTDQADQFHPLNQTEDPKQPDILINFQVNLLIIIQCCSSNNNL